MRSVALLATLGIGWGGAARARAESPADVVTQHNDNRRSGTTFGETMLSPTTVNADSFGKLATLPIDSQVYAQPLYLHGVDIPDAGLRDVVYIATVFNTLYAFDADTLDSTPLFQVSFGTSVPGKVIGCQDLGENAGITSTPTIDSDTGTMYLECRILDSDGGQHHMLHAIDVRNGQDVLPPAEVSASVAVATGDAGEGEIDFDPVKQNSRPGLLLANGNVYLAYGSLCDFGPYHGWVFSYSASTLERQDVFLTTPAGSQGGIWMSGGGLVADSIGNIYGAVGNGTMDLMDDGGVDVAMSLVRWTDDLQLADWFSPVGEAAGSKKDLDLGASPTLLLEDQGLLVGGGKEGILWVASSGNLGHQQPNDAQVQQIVTPMPLTTAWSGIASYPAPGGAELFLWGYGMALTAYQYAEGAFSQVDIGTLISPSHKAGCPLSISVDDPDAGPGIVWALVASFNNDYHVHAPGTLRAFSTSDLGTELWDSDINARDFLGDFAKFIPPTIADGRVFAPTFSNQINVYGLLPIDAGVPDDGGVDGGADGGGTEDGGGDGGEIVDGGVDAGSDAGPEEVDAGGVDAGLDSGVDGGVDGGIDGEPPDAGSPDSGQVSSPPSTSTSTSTAGNTGGHLTRAASGCGCTTGTSDWWWAGLPVAISWLRRRRREHVRVD